MNFTIDGLEGDRKAVARLRGLAERLGDTAGDAQPITNGEWADRLQTAREQFDACLDDDLNVSGGLGVLHETAKALGREEISPEVAARGLAFLQHVDGILGVIFAESTAAAEGLSAEEQALFDARIEARAAKDWAKSDELRDALLAMGVVVKDGSDGVTWERKR